MKEDINRRVHFMKIKDNSIQYKIEELNEAAQWLLEKSNGERVWLFDAPMGAGKTTLIKELCDLLGVEEVASSPTFAIVNEYHNQQDERLYHIDAYRLESERDGVNIGVGEYLNSGDYCFVEWPGVLDRLLPEEAFCIRIDPLGDDERQITLLGADASFIYDIR